MAHLHRPGQPKVARFDWTRHLLGPLARFSGPSKWVRVQSCNPTSAWKSGAVREVQVLPIRDKGVRACEALPNRDASQPRDCALIRIAPLLATLDLKTREVQALRDAGETIPADKLDATQIVTSDVAALIKEVLNMRATVTSLPESFDDYLKLSLNREFCMLQGLAGRFAASEPTEAQKARVIEAVRGAQTNLRNAAILTTCN